MNPTPRNRKEARRHQAWHLKQEGWSQRQIAEALGVSDADVSQWLARARLGGPRTLRHRPSPGAPRRLSAEHLARLPALLRRGPAAYGFRGEIWTRKRVAEVIRLEFGVVYHPSSVGRLLKVLRWSPQRPMRRARQRDQAAIAHFALRKRVTHSCGYSETESDQCFEAGPIIRINNLAWGPHRSQ